MKALKETVKTLMQMTAAVCVCTALSHLGREVRMSLLHCVAIAVTMRFYADLIIAYIRSRK